MPERQLPSQHTEPEPQSASPAHATHSFPRHCCPPGQSAAEQQLPTVHNPPQQVDPAPHCSGLVQAWHWLPTHTRPAQLAESQQSPRLQPPWQHRKPCGHSTSSWQLVQALLVQVAPAGQSRFWQHSPATQRPEQHRLPLPHC